MYTQKWSSRRVKWIWNTNTTQILCDVQCNSELCLSWRPNRQHTVMSVTATRDTTESKVANDTSTKVWMNNSALHWQYKVTTTDFQLSGSTHNVTVVKFIVNIIPTIALIQFDHHHHHHHHHKRISSRRKSYKNFRADHSKETKNIHKLLNCSSKNLRNDLQTRKLPTQTQDVLLHHNRS